MSSTPQDQGAPQVRQAHAAEPAGPTPGLRIATLGGVPVYIGKTWPIIAIVIVATFGPQVGSLIPDLGTPRSYAVAALFAILLLGSVLAHEAAHAVVATRAGYRVNRVVADLWGGHTAYETAGSRPGPSALVAIAGPAANGLLALVGWLIQPAMTGDVAYLLVGAVVWTNGFVALFNMLPGLPLDGGFLVDSLVWHLTGKRESGLIAAGWCGRVVAGLVLAWVLVLPLVRGGTPSIFSMVWGALIGAFLWAGATNAIRVGRTGRLLGGITVGSVWRRAAALPATVTVSDAMAVKAAAVKATGLNAGAGGDVALVALDVGGQPVGLVDDEALAQIPQHAWAHTALAAAIRGQPIGWVVDGSPDASIVDVVSAMQSLRVTSVAIRLGDGRIAGIVHARDLEAALSRPRS